MIKTQLTQEQIESLIKTELANNLTILIDPKKKDSFNQGRINTWQNLVAERIMYHLTQK